MNGIGTKKIEVDVKRLQKQMSFDYLEILELDDADSPTMFTEHPVPVKVARPKTGGFWIASARVTMRLKELNKSPVLQIPKTQIAKDWKHDILAVFLKVDGIGTVLVFYARRAFPAAVNLVKIGNAITII